MDMDSIEENIARVNGRMVQASRRAGRHADEVTLVAVSKTASAKAIELAFAAGLRHFGESRIQEAQPKIERLARLRPAVTWHLVGHLQSNKARLAADIFDIIHSVDSVKLAERLSKTIKGTLPILLQINVAGETTKSGFVIAEVSGVLEEVRRLPRLQVVGLMTIAPQVADPEQARPAFRRLRQLRDELGLKHLSMGMTDDFEVAIEEGATIVRIGRAIFGERLQGGPA